MGHLRSTPFRPFGHEIVEIVEGALAAYDLGVNRHLQIAQIAQVLDRRRHHVRLAEQASLRPLGALIALAVLQHRRRQVLVGNGGPDPTGRKKATRAIDAQRGQMLAGNVAVVVGRQMVQAALGIELPMHAPLAHPHLDKELFLNR